MERGALHLLPAAPGSGPTEPTATIMHRVLSELGCQREVLLWNASMLFAPGNRDPLRAEVAACAEVLELVCRGRAVFAVGRFAQVATGAPYIRHPSHGGCPGSPRGCGSRSARRREPTSGRRFADWTPGAPARPA